VDDEEEFRLDMEDEGHDFKYARRRRSFAEYQALQTNSSGELPISKDLMRPEQWQDIARRGKTSEKGISNGLEYWPLSQLEGFCRGLK
jgi:hypothetical protein